MIPELHNGRSKLAASTSMLKEWQDTCSQLWGDLQASGI